MTVTPVDTDNEVLAAQAREAVAQWKADIANMRAEIASGQVPDDEIFTLEHGIAERRQRIAQLQPLI